jgi:hypothetical protein
MVAQWGISNQESSSDHNIIKYVIGQEDSSRESVDFQNVRYLFKKENCALFQENLIQIAKTKLCGLHNAETTEDLDIMLCAIIAEEADIEKSTEMFHAILKTACNKIYRKHRPSKIKTTTTQISSMVERRTKYTAKKNKRPQTETSENKK